MALAAGTAVTIAQDASEPVFPEKINFTLNGQSELPGVTVEQEANPYGLSISITGSCDAEQIAMTFETPEGWDGLLMSAPWGEVSSKIPSPTRGEYDWMTFEEAARYGYEKGNTITLDVDGEENYAYLALYKGDKVYATSIDLTFEVSQGSGSETPGDDEPVFPKSFIATLINDGLEMTQTEEWGVLTMKITGEIAESEAIVIIDTPEGWDGLLSFSWSEDAHISDGGVSPRNASAKAGTWLDMSSLTEKGWVKGNRFIFTPNGQEQDIQVCLYKGDKVYLDEFLSLEAIVTSAEIEAPAIPESYEVTFSAPGPEVKSQGEEYGAFYITVGGKCASEKFDVTLGVPEGWDGFIGFVYEEETRSGLTRAQASDWMPVDILLGMGYEKSNTFTFPADGEDHSCYFFLYKGDYADTANGITMEICVDQDTTGVASVESAGSVRYFNLQGAPVANPQSGVYVKVVDGKAIKTIVK